MITSSIFIVVLSPNGIWGDPRRETYERVDRPAGAFTAAGGDARLLRRADRAFPFPDGGRCQENGIRPVPLHLEAGPA